MIIYEGGEHEWLHIPRYQCDNPACKRTSRMLPHCLTPYKHYAEEVISETIDEHVIPEESDFRPSEQTASRWKHWILKNELNISGYLKSIGHRLLGFTEDLMKAEGSLLEILRKRQPDGWLKIIICTIYNAGAKLDPCYD